MRHAALQHAAAQRALAQKAFTLLELMVVVAIIALLLVITLPSYHQYSERIAISAARHKLVEIMYLQNRYFSEHASYTTQLTADLGIATLSTERGDYRITANACGRGLATCVELRAVALADDKPNLILDSLGNKSPLELWK